MPGGSAEEGENDRQCKHCGLWYALRGLDNHEESCKFATVDHRVQELTDPFARERAEDVDDDRGEGAPEAPGTRTESAPEPPDTQGDPAPDAPGTRPDPAPDTTDVEADAAATRTDGGPSSLPDDFGDADDAGDDVQEASDGDGDPDDECPRCGASESVPVDALRDAILDAAPRLRQYDELCVACSFDEDGELNPPVEAY